MATATASLLNGLWTHFVVATAMERTVPNTHTCTLHDVFNENSNFVFVTLSLIKWTNHF